MGKQMPCAFCSGRLELWVVDPLNTLTIAGRDIASLPFGATLYKRAVKFNAVIWEAIRHV